jgi:hypothetical protein
MKMKEKKKGLGDQVEKIIETVAPKLAAKAKEKGCNCNKRKEWLNNNFGAIFG